MTAELPHIYGIVERWLAKAPDTEALAFGDRSWTWSELDERVRRAAGALRSAGVAPGDRIAVVDKNHPACLELTLAASLIGAANAVVNFRLAPEELAYVVDDSRAVLAVVGAEFADTVAALRDTLPRLATVVVLGGESDEYEQWLAAATPLADADRHPATDDDCFLQLYTSGTTGWPKGALLTQRSMTAHTVAVGRAYDMDESTVNVVAMPLFHVGGTSWALGSMYTGSRTIVVREMIPDAILDLVERRRATHAFFVPAVVGMLLAEPDRARTALSSLRVLGYGGSPMPASLMQKTLATLDTPLYSVYGMTELSGVFCVLGPDEHRDPERTHLLASAGSPLPGSVVRVVDPATGEDVDDGQVGEFWVRSDQAMAGYWNKPDATADVFVDGWLRTGDAGRVDESGYLFLEDRVKDMIISGGENVYPAEVERVLATHPQVAEVAVIGAPHEKWGETVKAVVVAQPGSTPDPAELIAYCRDRLAHYKCPSIVELIDALPRNPTGKILKRELREPRGA
ncbi:Long-chain-fatty-acid--CoA ligase [Pseudonocardia sp. Ae717_Ps2]|uniref:long-chain-fatty-acid--CoA ligase n=1 Tax=unclassified Pseudonocardia TaxID=2619320 RepID=UPI00094B40A8|nr:MULTISPECIES: long-chain-fatty-acid--CoA ligase [unclassified Pseudonocardia]OLM12090.1 Long-chain-fatty-acid--CoA ligase [Pseudonocardia sp. Ae505_Ps2]OLM29462.1 Long-chain-fatty-acid--CoA ligase [Pseudonocardia sp. Ae717_Ps2]